MPKADDVPAGFKQTEVGMIPEDWNTTSLGDLQVSDALEVRNGFPCGDHNLDGKGIGHLRPMNVTDTGQIDLTTVKYIPPDMDLSSYYIKHGDIIFNNTNSEKLVGKTALYQGKSDQYVLSNHMTYMRLSNFDVMDRFFLASYLHSRWFDGYYQTICRRHVNQASIGKERIREIKIPFPPLPEQRAIAHVLSKIQAAAETQAKITERARELKRALMAKLFTEGLRGEPLKETEIGMMPESWEVVSLGDVCTFTTGKLNSERAVIDGQYPFFTCSRETFKIDTYSFDQEAILLAGNNAQGIYSVKYYKGKFDAYQRTYIITVRSKEQLNYFYLLYEVSRKLNLLRQQSIGATTKFLTASIIRSVKLSLPTLEEQREIAHILQTVDAKIEAAERKRAMLDELFRAMLGQLMTGRVRTTGLAV